jgi:hypothetical protein
MVRGMEGLLAPVPVEVEAVVCRDWSGRPVEDDEIPY